MRCFGCGSEGHLERDCPNQRWIASDAAADGRPRWCGNCDENSRHIELADGRVKRCQCHPNSHEQLRHHRKCPRCHATVVTWDTAEDCARHILAGIQRPYIGQPPKPGPGPAVGCFPGGLPPAREYPGN